MTTRAPDPAELGSPTPPPARRWGPRPSTAVAIAYVSGIFVTAMDMHIVNVALPTLSRTFHAPLSDVQWTVIAYLLTLAVVIPASGWIGDRVGTRRTFLVALALFTVASALCGLAQNLGELIAARALQGVGGGMLTPTGTAMLYRVFGPAQRARVARTLMIPILVAPGTAPILGGALTESISWRWVFLVNIPIGLATLTFSYLFLPEERNAQGGRLDVRGLILSGCGLSALLYAVSEGSVLGWGSVPIVASGLAGLGLLAAFARGTMGQIDPLLRLGLLRNRLFRATNIVFALSTGPFLASLYLTPIFLQEVLHQSPVASGTTTFVEALGVALGAQTLGRLYPRVGPRVMAGVGAAGLDHLSRVVPARRRPHQPVAGQSADAVRRPGQQRRVSRRADLDVHHHLRRRHGARVGDLQHPAPVDHRPQRRRRDHGRCRRRRQPGRRFS